jgi:predicted RNA-binding Zn-ribbon protein involved in translation (DUF1610 family)
LPLFKGFLDTLKKVKHSSPKPVFCPSCRSPKLKRLQNYGILPSVYHCEKCGYQGTLVLEIEPED